MNDIADTGAGARSASTESAERPVVLFLAGDAMLGRGVDQILPHPSEPRLYEEYVRDARGYLELAERRAGSVPRPVDYDYVWGDALAELSMRDPALRLIN